MCHRHQIDSSQSYWARQRRGSTSYSVLTEDIEADVVIIGGGIAGISTAYYLKKRGLNVVVLEKNTVASGTTAGSTGKVTAQHGIMYADLIAKFGLKNAQLYADAHSTAIQDTADVINNENIACDWQEDNSYVFTTRHTKVHAFKKEAGAVQRLSLPGSFTTDTGLPFEVSAAVKFNNQAKFNAATYTNELAKRVSGRGSHVFEYSQVVSIQDGATVRASTLHGSVAAKHAVIATKVPAWPLIARYTYAAIEYPETSYIIAGRSDSLTSGMYISPDDGHYSLLPSRHDGINYLLVGGENHIPGPHDIERRLNKLRQYGKQWFNIRKIEYSWKAMDYITYDNLPAVGKLYPWSKNTYVITGFKKWGLSSSMVAAKVITKAITGSGAAFENLLTPHRTSAFFSIPKVAFMKLLK